MTTGYSYSFEVLKRSTSNAARRGRMVTRHGTVETPVFMPVGTLGLVKGLDPRDLQALGAQISLANAYHLMLRPGDKTVESLGGLHAMTGSNHVILTDSGGFQVFSLASLRKIDDEGVVFRSHIDGSSHHLSPERLVEVQQRLAPDIAMVLDECPPATAAVDQMQEAIARTTLWAKRALQARTRQDIAWFGIVQGGTFLELRRQHALTMSQLDFDGFAIGGVSVGESCEQIQKTVEFTAPLLPENKPRYLMGVGTPQDLVRSVASGIDMFDCVMPARNARNGMLFTSRGRYHVKNSVHRECDDPIDPECRCYTCVTFSRGALRHLYIAKELSYFRLATLHNLSFYVQLMADIRRAIECNTFHPQNWLQKWQS